MGKVFNGNSFAEKKKRVLKREFAAFRKNRGRFCSLAAIQVGRNQASDIYLRLKKTAADKLGVKFRLFYFPQASPGQLKGLIARLNNDSAIDGIMIQMPLPQKWSFREGREVVEAIDPKKDIDGLTAANLGLILTGEPLFLPATVRAVWEILGEAGITEKNVIGKNVCILGKSNLVGKPLANLLIGFGATVFSCNSKTRDIGGLSRQADVLVSATGERNLVNKEMVKPEAIVIDVGEPRGDVDFPSVKKVTSFITPVPGGVGPVTVVSLFENLILTDKW